MTPDDLRALATHAGTHGLAVGLILAPLGRWPGAGGWSAERMAAILTLGPLLWLGMRALQRRGFNSPPLRSRLVTLLVTHGLPSERAHAAVAPAIRRNPAPFRRLPTVEHAWWQSQGAWPPVFSLLDTLLIPVVTLYAYAIMRDVFFSDEHPVPVTDSVAAPAVVSPTLVPVPTSSPRHPAP
jgi:hypothetical protein